ncbi:MAG: SufS family cysteine desulfurase [Parcubacteria group bacterium]|nr:SufS family cysteine desulfurase [Parcubacteria group bacterium]
MKMGRTKQSSPFAHATCAEAARADFPFFSDTHDGRPVAYLDNASTTQMPRSVMDAMERYLLTGKANVHRGLYTLAQRATEEYESARDTVASMLNASREEIIFTRGTTESLNTLAYSLGRSLSPGDEVLVSECEHHSNIVPWQQQAKMHGFTVRYIPVPHERVLTGESVRPFLTTKTKIVSLAHVSHVFGTVHDIQSIAQTVHDAIGAYVIVDAAQSAPHCSLDVREIDCDFLAFSGHKLYGPTGIGVLFGKRALLERTDPFLTGGEMIREVTLAGASWNDLPWKFEAGTPPIAEAIGLGAAVRYIESRDRAVIEAFEQELTRSLRSALEHVPGVIMYGPSGGAQRSICSFAVKGIPSHDVAEVLNRSGVAVRSGHHCAMPCVLKLNPAGIVRASLSFYNTPEDIGRLIDGIRKAQDIFQTRP